MYDTSLSFNANQNTTAAAAFARAWAASCPPIVILVSHKDEYQGGWGFGFDRLWLRRFHTCLNVRLVHMYGVPLSTRTDWCEHANAFTLGARE